MAVDDAKLTEQEECLSRGGAYPVGVATTGIKERSVSCLTMPLGVVDESVFDFKRAHFFEFFLEFLPAIGATLWLLSVVVHSSIK